MPTVPRFDSPQVAPAGPSGARFDAPQAQNFAPRHTMQMGQAVEAAGGEMARIAAERADEANQLRRIDARNQAREKLNTLIYDSSEGVLAQKGIAALERSSKKALPDEYAERFKGTVDEITATLGNDRQRELFKRDAADMHLQLNETAQRHLLKEMATYQVGTYDGAIKSQQRAIALMGGNGQDMIDPVTKRSRIDDATEEIRAAVYAKAHQLGVPQELAEQEAITQLSAAHHDAFAAAVQAGKLQYAEGYFNKYRAQMTPDHILAAQGLITKQMDAKEATTAATQAIKNAAPRLAPTDMDRAFNILLGTESGGKQFDDNGRPLTSRKGAIGIAQVMPATAPEAAKLAGLPWDENRYRTDAEYNKALGRAYFNKQLQVFGDLSLAYAAYNAGPGRVDAALKNAGKPVMVDANTDPGAPKQMGWLSLLPKETQAYVAKNMAAFNAGGGVPPRPTLADIDTALQSNPAIAGNPALLKLAREEAARQFKMQEDAIKQRDEGALAEAQRQLVANGGNYAGLPASVRNAIPPGKVDEVMGFAGRISKGAPIETNWALYYDLKTKPDLLAKTNLMAFRGKLGDTEFKALVSQQEDLRSGKDLTQVRTTRDVLSQYMREAGIDPTPKDTDKTGAEKVGRIWAAFESRVREREQAKGGKLTPEEVQKTAAQLFTKVGVSGMLWDSEKPAVMLDAGDKIKVPDGERAKIAAALSRAGRPVTEENIVALFRRSRGMN